MLERKPRVGKDGASVAKKLVGRNAAVKRNIFSKNSLINSGMLIVKKFSIVENIGHNSKSKIYFDCSVNKSGFTGLVQNKSIRPLFMDKVDFDNFEILLSVECLYEGLVQKVDAEGGVLMSGEFYHGDDCSHTQINLACEINKSSWLKLKSDLLLIKDELVQLDVYNINFGNLIKDDENACITAAAQASLSNYKIIRILN